MRRLAAVSLATSIAAGACTPTPDPPTRARLDVADVLGSGVAAGFDRALQPRPFVFPDDHGAHPDFAAEWWYFTGNLETTTGHRLGYQVTFFRTALVPPGARTQRPSLWATNQVWMAHFAVTDVDGTTFQAFDRFQRGALGLAGADAEPWRVWLDDWSVEQVGETPFPARLRARQSLDGNSPAGDYLALDLLLEPLKPAVLQGERGLSRKGPSPGNASFYYSLSRLRTRGTVRVNNVDHAVTGLSWLDREWSTSVLESGQVGWDWFAVQLDDGSELMYYQIRSGDGSAAPQSAGTLVRADGSYVALAADSTDVRVDAFWQSPLDGTRYPSAWTLSVPERGIELSIVPLLAQQELDLAFRYWEGAVEVVGRGAHGVPVSGRGYVELTGYAEGGPHP